MSHEAAALTLYAGLLCHLPLHGANATDVSGLDNHATLVGTVAGTADYDGRASHAVALAGGASLDLTACAGGTTVAMWVRAAAGASAAATQCTATAGPSATLAWTHVAGVVMDGAVTSLVVNGRALADPATRPLAAHVLSALQGATVRLSSPWSRRSQQAGDPSLSAQRNVRLRERAAA